MVEILLVAVGLIRIGYLMFYFYLFNTEKDDSDQIKLEGVSIVICSRDQLQNLKLLINALLVQDYPSFEIIVVDDFSKDDTWHYLSKLQHPQLRCFRAENDLPGKKSALELGIHHSKYSWVLLTDADCEPASDQWVRGMMTARSNGEVVLGYGPLKKTNTLVNAFSRYETTITGIQYFSFAHGGIPYMGVGRNLLYSKALYEQVGGFKSHMDVVSGDDDLFIQSVSKIAKISTCTNPATFMYSDSKTGWKSYFRQKSRHVSTASRYDAKSKFLLTLYAASHGLFYLLLMVSLLRGNFIFSALVILDYCIISMFFLRPWFRKLDGESLWRWIPFFDLLFVCYYLLLAPSLITKRKVKWN